MQPLGPTIADTCNHGNGIKIPTLLENVGGGGNDDVKLVKYPFKQNTLVRLINILKYRLPNHIRYIVHQHPIFIAAVIRQWRI